MDKTTLLAGLDFSRARLLGILDTIEKAVSAQDVAKVLAWRPGPGRAHIGWQAMHCAATHDRYLNVRLKGNGAGKPIDPALCEAFAGGSVPSDTNIPTLPAIRAALETHFTNLKNYVETADLSIVQDFPNNVKRTIGESIVLLTWHEAHHQGQIHITWNMYKAAHNIA